MLCKHHFVWYICISLFEFLCIPVQTQEFPAYSVVLSSIALKAIELNTTTCGQDLQSFRDGVNQRALWSLKVLDSSGGFKPGFLYGNNYWQGSRSQCLDTINKNHPMSPLDVQYSEYSEFPPFELNYFVVLFKLNSTLQYRIHMFTEDVVTLGLCLPASCSTNNISFILERALHERVISMYDLYSANIHLIQIKDLKYDAIEYICKLSSGALIFICIGLGFCFMTITGTIYDVFIHQENLKKNEMKKIDDSIKDVTTEMETKLNSFLHWKRLIRKILICFSAYTNTKKIFSTELEVGTIPVIHGLKFLNMCILITIHSMYFAMDVIDNKVWVLRFMENCGAYLFDPLIGAVTVDIYLFSSACLVTYCYLRDKINEILIKTIGCRGKLTEFFTHIIKRFFRLTPPYIMVIGAWQIISNWFDKTSQFYMHEKSHETCSKYWWRNILYINNFFDVDAMCMSWSWYLAVDMQCYVITVIILILSTMYFNTAVTVLGALLIGSIIITGYISYVYEYVPSLYELYRLIDILYIPPWTRINSYIIGIIAGYILIKLNNHLLWKRKIIIFCWCVFCLTTACNVFVLSQIYKGYVSVLNIAIYIALQKTFSAIGIAWIVIACSTNHGGIVNNFLSMKVWIPLSRLTYCAYLLNPVIILSIYLSSETPIHFDFLPCFVLAVGYIVISYLCAYILSLMVEMPCLSLIQMFIQHRNMRFKKVL